MSREVLGPTPNGAVSYKIMGIMHDYHVSVIPDPTRPLRWEVLVANGDGTPTRMGNSAGVMAGMATSEVERLLKSLES